MMVHKHIISMLVEDSPGVLTRIAGMFSRRGFNIDTISVGKTLKPGISKMIISVKAKSNIIEQVEKQCNKIIDVIKVNELSRDSSSIRELCMIKVKIKDSKAKDDLFKYAGVYDAEILEISHNYAIIQIVNSPEKINSFIELMKKYGIKDISRSGMIGLKNNNNNEKKNSINIDDNRNK